MKKANLARGIRGRRDPKSLVLETISGLQKSWRDEVHKSVYWQTVSVGTISKLVIYDDLQDVIDTNVADYPVLKPYATKKAIDALKPQEEQAKSGPRYTPQYWECGGCSEDFIHAAGTVECPRCHDTEEGAILADVTDVIALSLPFDEAAQEVWEKAQQEPEKTDPGDELAARYYAGQIDSMGNPT